MPPHLAKQQELIRSFSKDYFYLSLLKSHFGNLIKSTFGPANWLKWKREVDTFSEFTYFLLTTVQGSQTLGEEYVGMIQVNHDLRNVPSLSARLLSSSAYCFGPYVLEKILKFMEQSVSKSKDLDVYQKQMYEKSLEFFRKLIPILQQLHLVCFYFTGLYYDFSKRLVGTKNILIRGKNESSSWTYPLIGLLGGIRLMWTALTLFKGIFSDLDQKNTKTVDRFRARRTDSKSDGKCSLCLDFMQDISTTSCGHLFCWHCIIEWCQSRAECPTCRSECLPSKVVYLHSFQRWHSVLNIFCDTIKGMKLYIICVRQELVL